MLRLPATLVLTLIGAAPLHAESLWTCGLGLTPGDWSQPLVQEIDAGTGAVLRSFPYPAGGLTEPRSVTRLGSSVFMTDGAFGAPSRLFETDLDGNVLAAWTFPGFFVSALDFLRDGTLAATGFVAGGSPDDDRLQLYSLTSSGLVLLDEVSLPGPQISFGGGATNGVDELYAIDRAEADIYVFDLSGNPTGFIDTQLPQPGAGTALAYSGSSFYVGVEVGNVWTHDYIAEVAMDGSVLRTIEDVDVYLHGLGRSAGEPVAYCTAKSGLVCGVPTIGFSGIPSAGASAGFVIRAAPARAQRPGLVLYSCAGRAAIPFQGGLLCVNPSPLRRVPAVSSGGTGGGCDGVFATDFNAFASGHGGGQPDPCLTVHGQRVNAQWWGRDSVSTGSFLSDALEFEM